MIPSSRTPEGIPDHCPICGKAVCLETSSFPSRDAPCPHCGHLLWFASTDEEAFQIREYLDQFAFEDLPIQQPIAEPGTGIGWMIFSVVTAAIVLASDGTVWTSLAWLVFSLIFGKRILPALFLFGKSASLENNFWRGVALGWAVVAGIPVGMFFGVLLAWVYEWPGSVVLGGLAGLVIGPLIAAIEGMVIAGLIVSGVWVVTGRNLARL